MQRIIDILKDWRMTALAGIFLVIDFVLSFTNIRLPIAPVWVTIIICGTPLLRAAVKRLFVNRKITAAFLISTAMIASIWIGEVFAAGEVAFIMALGEWLEDRTVARVQQGLKRLLGLTPQTAHRLNAAAEGGVETVEAETLALNDIVRVLPGEAIPADGVIVAGETSVNQAVITGESLPLDRTVDDKVFCGTLNCYGSIDVRVTAVGEDSSLKKLIRLVKEAESKKAPMQRLADRWASILVPTALAIALGTFFVTENVTRAVTVLVVFCPCSLALATPTAIMAAIGLATKHGVLIKSGAALEKMGRITCVAFDKTGTLTLGRLHVTDIVPLQDGLAPEHLLALTAAVEIRSEHPLGKAIVQHALEQNIALPEAADFSMAPGLGVNAVCEGRPIVCGTAAYLQKAGVVIGQDAQTALDSLRAEGKAALLVGSGNTCIGVVALADTLRPDAQATVTDLHALGLETVLLSGDHTETARYFAREAGIDTVKAELLPEQKTTSIEELRAAGKQVCMVGDGVNDAPALKTADVGIAMGAVGTDIAADTADIVLTGDEISKLPRLQKLSRMTLRVIKLSIFISMGINFLAVGLATFGILTPVTGAIVHNVSSVLVILNASRIYERRFE